MPFRLTNQKTLETTIISWGALGGVKGDREWRWVKKEYINAPDAVNYFKVFFPRSYGSGVIEDPAPNMVIGEPGEIANQSFLYIGEIPGQAPGGELPELSPNQIRAGNAEYSPGHTGYNNPQIPIRPNRGFFHAF